MIAPIYPYRFGSVKLSLCCTEEGVWRIVSENSGHFDYQGAAQTLAADLAEDKRSLIHNWFEADAEIREDYLSLNDTIGEIVNSIDMQKYIKSQLGKTIKIPFPISAISIKPIASLLNKTKKGKELTTLANQFLQTMKK